DSTHMHGTCWSSGLLLHASTHMRGLPRLCVGLHNLGWACTSSTHMLASTHIRKSGRTWKLSLSSTHMLAVLRICVALEWASKDRSRLSSSKREPQT
ncbi:hypothetical protein PIB30_110543, partial [Stylosanthes scabra]|nr:hypothetical protein [Stylosanthes scabra]